MNLWGSCTAGCRAVSSREECRACLLARLDEYERTARDLGREIQALKLRLEEARRPQEVVVRVVQQVQHQQRESSVTDWGCGW